MTVKPADTDVLARIDRIESHLAISQLPIRYAMAVDSRDVDAWVNLFIPNVQVGRDKFGREALRDFITPALRNFRRSLHQICGQRIDFVEDDYATGNTYCRAEHEVGDRWIVMGICYFDEFRRHDGSWLFSRRREKHWYSADINERPQAVGFDSWGNGAPPTLPGLFPTWAPFWEEGTA